MSAHNPRHWLLHELEKGHKVTTQQLAKKFNLSRQRAHLYILELVKKGEVVRLGGRRNSYYVANRPNLLKKISPTRIFKHQYPRQKLEESQVFSEIAVQGYLKPLKKDIQNIVQYAFTEMLNNAIDHSSSKNINVTFEVNDDLAQFKVIDRGVGIYKHIQKKKHLTDEMEAIQELLKGKTTTMPEAHSGEGIFFTSKVAGRLEINSDGKEIIFDNDIGDVFLKDVRKRKGTAVFFRIRSQSSRNLNQVFKEYTGDDFEFDKTQVIVKLFKEGTELISRSQARRLLANLEKFKKITLDFKGIETVGQGFSDEVFRVFKRRFPEIQIEFINANENVSFMISRAMAQ